MSTKEKTVVGIISILAALLLVIATDYWVGSANGEAETFITTQIGAKALCQHGCTDKEHGEVSIKEALVANSFLSRSHDWYSRLSVKVAPAEHSSEGLITVTDENASYLACRMIVSDGADITVGDTLLVNGKRIDYENDPKNNHCHLLGGNTVVLKS